MKAPLASMLIALATAIEPQAKAQEPAEGFVAPPGIETAKQPAKRPRPSADLVVTNTFGNGYNAPWVAARLGKSPVLIQEAILTIKDLPYLPCTPKISVWNDTALPDVTRNIARSQNETDAVVECGRELGTLGIGNVYVGGQFKRFIFPSHNLAPESSNLVQFDIGYTVQRLGLQFAFHAQEIVNQPFKHGKAYMPEVSAGHTFKRGAYDITVSAGWKTPITNDYYGDHGRLADIIGGAIELRKGNIAFSFEPGYQFGHAKTPNVPAPIASQANVSGTIKWYVPIIGGK